MYELDKNQQNDSKKLREKQKKKVEKMNIENVFQ